MPRLEVISKNAHDLVTERIFHIRILFVKPVRVILEVLVMLRNYLIDEIVDVDFASVN